MTAEVAAAASFIIALLLLGMQTFRLFDSFLTKKNAQTTRDEDKSVSKERRDEDEAARTERQAAMDERLDRIDRDNEIIRKISSDTNDKVRIQNGRIEKLEKWRDSVEIRIAKGRRQR